MGLDMYIQGFDIETDAVREEDIPQDEQPTEQWSSSYSGFSLFRDMLSKCIELIQEKETDPLKKLRSEYSATNILLENQSDVLPEKYVALPVDWQCSDINYIADKKIQASENIALECHSDCDGMLIPYPFSIDTSQTSFQSSYQVYAELLMLEDSGFLEFWKNIRNKIKVAEKLQTEQSSLYNEIEWFLKQANLLRKMCAESILSGCPIIFA